MADQAQRSWLARKLESAIRRGFMRAYHQVRVDPARFLMQLRSAHGLPISGYEGVFQVDLRLLDSVAEETIHNSMRLAAFQGAGFGLGGALTLVPDMSLMAAITLRTIQKLSLIYGFGNSGSPPPAPPVSTSAASLSKKNSSTSLCRELFSASQCPPAPR